MKNLNLFLALLLILSFLFTSCQKETVPPAPVASFTCDKVSGNEPLTVNFTSTSTGEITSYLWEFGDGLTSIDIKTSHLYTIAGTYTVKLTVIGPGGSDSKDIVITVLPTPAPVASFNCDKTSGNAPFLVNFTSYSTGSITSYSWDFGDGGTSILENPSHTYTTSGTFDVILTVKGPGGSDSENKVITVTSGTDITFYNPVFTDIYITINGITKTITPSSSVTFNSVTGTSASYYAYTMGATTSGTQIGLKLIWDETLVLTGVKATYNLNVSNSYFFLYMTNKGTHTLIDLYVNYGLTSETYDDISITNNSVKYKLGYYKAWTNSNVRMYYKDQPLSYSYWNSLNLPWTENQSISLSNQFKSTSMDIIDNSNIIPAQLNTYKKDINTIDLYCK